MRRAFLAALVVLTAAAQTRVDLRGAHWNYQTNLIPFPDTPPAPLRSPTHLASGLAARSWSGASFSAAMPGPKPPSACLPFLSR
jgi:hypothetical protein